MSLLQAVNKINNINLVVIGNGKSYKKKCLEYIKKNKITSKVLFLNNVSFNDMPAIYQSADMMVYPLFLKDSVFQLLKHFIQKRLLLQQMEGVLRRQVDQIQYM